NTVYKKLLVLDGTKLVACLLASDFPSENPRPQTRNFPYTNTLCTIMRNILLIILISVYTSSFSQVNIDTSEIKSIRYEWNINPKTKDTTLLTSLIKYKSGFFNWKMESSNDSTKFGSFSLSKGEYSEVNENSKNYA